MRAGQLRHRLTLQNNNPVADTTGQQIETWTDLATVWGSIETTASRETWAGYRMKATVTHAIRIRYIAGLNASSRVVLGSRVFNLAGPPINRDERNIELMLPVSEVV